MLFLQVELQNALHCATLSPWSQGVRRAWSSYHPVPKFSPFSRYRKLML